jgi:hypothetical protein
MAVVLYRRGDTHVVEGVKCERGLFPVAQLQARLADGWVTDPRNVDAEEEWETASGPEVESEPETSATVTEEPKTAIDEAAAPAGDKLGVTMDMLDEATKQPKPTEEEIRQVAKGLGIKSWHNMGLDKLNAKIAEATE